MPVRQSQQAAPTPVHPEGSGNPESYDDTELLSRLDTLEKKQNFLEKTISFVKETNWVLLVVLALGFIALLVTVIGGVVQSLNDKTSVQLELMKSMDRLSNELELQRERKTEFEETNAQTPSPKPALINPSVNIEPQINLKDK